MRRRILTTIFLGGFALTGCARRMELSSGKFVDLTHSFDEQTIYWPTEKGFVLERGPAGVTEKGYYYTANRFCSAEHGGTHIDAPIHFFQGHNTLDTIPLRQLIGRAVLIDVRMKCAENPNYQIVVDDLVQWESRHNERLDEAILLLRTGFAAFWPSPAKYLGTEARGPEAVAKLHFPACTQTLQSGSPRIGQCGRWVLTPRALTLVNRLIFRVMSACLRRTFRPSRTSPTWISFRKPGLSC